MRAVSEKDGLLARFFGLVQPSNFVECYYRVSGRGERAGVFRVGVAPEDSEFAQILCRWMLARPSMATAANEAMSLHRRTWAVSHGA